MENIKKSRNKLVVKNTDLYKHYSNFETKSLLKRLFDLFFKIIYFDLK